VQRLAGWALEIAEDFDGDGADGEPAALGFAGACAGLGAAASSPASNRNGTILMRRLDHGGRDWVTGKWRGGAGFGWGVKRSRRWIPERGGGVPKRTAERIIMPRRIPHRSASGLPLRPGWGTCEADCDCYAVRPGCRCDLFNRNVFRRHTEAHGCLFGVDLIDRAVMGFVIGTSGLKLHGSGTASSWGWWSDRSFRGSFS